MLKLAGFFLAVFLCVRMTQYVKPPLSIDEQLDQLSARGLGIGDPHRAHFYLQRVGYYRLMGYLYPQRKTNSDSFQAGATFDDAVSLYEFDRALRDLVMEGIGHIEIAVRTSVTYHFSHAYGAFGHLDSAHFATSASQHADWIEGIFKEIQRSKEVFIRHYQSKYTSPAFPKVPIWMATEIMSLGSLSRFYGALRGREQKLIAHDAGVAAPVLQNWLHVTSVARNVVAHHGRLWNKELGVSATRPRSVGWSEREARFPVKRAFFLLLILRKLLVATAADEASWRDRVDAHLKGGLSSHARVQAFGADTGWDTHALWCP